MLNSPSNTHVSTHSKILQYIATETGLVFSPNRLASAEAGIQRSMGRVGVTDIDIYLDLISRGGLPMDDLLAELTIGETYFFRDPGQFEFLRNHVIPSFKSGRSGSRAIRAWSAGCASGEEAYSMSIMLSEETPNADNIIVGTDISRARLSMAARARYRKWSLRSLRHEQIEQYFIQRGDSYSLMPVYQKGVNFSYLNLSEDTYPAMSTPVWGMDIIMCRNVLIYFDRQTVTKVARRLVDTLSDRGWLLIGPSDPVLSDYIDCEVVQSQVGLFYRRKTGVGKPSISVRSPVPPTPSVASAPAPSRVSPPSLSSHNSPPVPPLSEVVRASAPDLLAEAYKRRDYAEVAKVAEEQLRNDPYDEAVVVALVRALANLGRIEEAERACVAGLEKHKRSLDLIYLHAILLIQVGHDAQGALQARRALYFDRNMIVAYLALATALKNSGEIEKAQHALSNAETLLGNCAPETIVPYSDGETAGRLLAMARAQRALLKETR